MNSKNNLTPAERSSNQPRIVVRCAIYTRKSTDEGLEQEFNSLDAQRESAEAYIASQVHEGWTCLADNYDDGGFTGGNMERPAMKRLMDDIEAGKVDCVVVYKVDRLSRSLLDFARIMEVFERQNVSFVSVTQQFNTATSMGRLILNVLLSFAQFERELISERTRDKIAAARRKGKWSGGMPILGYDIIDSKLVVNEDEAIRVRQIFRLYLEMGSMISTIREVERRGWRTKHWITKKGKAKGGRLFNKNSLYNLLTNVTYLGKSKHNGQTFEGEHQAIVDAELFQQVQSTMRRNHCTGGPDVRNRYGALLRGLLFCTPCGCSMTHTFTKQRNKRYRYYVCSNAQKRGRDTCPGRSLPAAEIERFVVDQIRAIGRDPALVAETLRQTRREPEERIAELKTDLLRLARQLKRDHAELRKLVTEQGEVAAARMADLHERIRGVEQRETQIREEITRLQRQVVDERDLETAMAKFDPVWDSLTSREQIRVLNLLIQRIDFDGEHGDVAITFHPHGIKTLAEELERNEEEAA